MVNHSMYSLDAVFRALADGTRRDILRRLSFGEHTAGELAEPFEMSVAAVSKHVKTLEAAGLVSRNIVGRHHVFRLNPDPMASAMGWLGFYERFWNDRLDALERELQSANKGDAT